jgi:hypothetical protein
MPLIYGNVPRTLPGSYRYANSALVDETLTQGQNTTPSYFEVAKHLHDENKVTLAITASGNYELLIEVSIDDGVTFKTLRSVTQADPAIIPISYVDSSMKLRVRAVTLTGSARVVLRQGG